MFLLVPASLQGSAKIFALGATSFLRYVSVASLLSRGHVDGDACGTQQFLFSNSKFYFSEIILGFRCRGADHQSVLVPQVSIGPDGLYNFIIFGAV